MSGTTSRPRPPGKPAGVSNATVAEMLRQYAAVLALQGVNKFKLKAYRRAAETIEGLHDSVADRVRRGSDLTDLPGIGTAISEVVQEIVRSGRLARLEKTVAELPAGQAELGSHPALDARTVARVYRKLGIGTLAELKERLDRGEVREAFGPRVEFSLRRGLDDRPRHLLWSVRHIAESVEKYLRGLPGVVRVSATGSLRRRVDTVGDLNFLVASDSAADLFKRFGEFGAVLSSETLGKSARRYRLSSGLDVALQWTSPESWGLALIVATGSAGHLEDLASAAASAKLKFTAASLGRRGVDLSEEEAVYEALGLRFMEPELREGQGEVEAARAGSLPRLLRLEDLRGDLHMHTTESDGANTIEQMAAAAQARGYEYIAITDHSQSLKITNGLTEERLRKHIRAIDRLNAKLRGFRVLKSAEVDILEDGRLDYSDAMLRELDFTICSIHSRFALNREKQTARILRAMDNPYFNILGHATGRLLLKREGYELDIDRVFEHAAAAGCFFEINSSPDRLDLSDVQARKAKEHGIRIAVNTDAHSIRELDFLSAGVNQARRAWLGARDVLNAQPLESLLSALRR